MIAFVEGTVAQVGAGFVVLGVGGLGYKIFASAATLSRLPRPHGRAVCEANDQPRNGETVRLHTHLQTKEDGTTLFGFLSVEELDMFGLLITVSGIGPKAALSILATLKVDHITNALLTGDAVAFTKAPGIGKKTAERIVLELKDKMADSALPSGGAASLSAPQDGEKQEALEALQALGYSRSESLRAVLEVAQPNMPANEIIRLALRKM